MSLCVESVLKRSLNHTAHSLFLDIKSFHSQVVSQPLIAGHFTATFQNPSVISQPQKITPQGNIYI